jgi:hypothetical protein
VLLPKTHNFTIFLSTIPQTIPHIIERTVVYPGVAGKFDSRQAATDGSRPCHLVPVPRGGLSLCRELSPPGGVCPRRKQGAVPCLDCFDVLRLAMTATCLARVRDYFGYAALNAALKEDVDFIITDDDDLLIC